MTPPFFVLFIEIGNSVVTSSVVTATRPSESHRPCQTEDVDDVLLREKWPSPRDFEQLSIALPAEQLSTGPLSDIGDTEMRCVTWIADR